ncbi:MFS transporter [filamentous cyanobacterium LEGE 11480]|uniref:MFS transporter n=1 Tax=Romeriopsis navalis LEGE 11480 TaxID=2777977 RepID=A0A928Z5G1_9CYAN|nr:MFS transporter [Romeriopsis navalis]MBE9031235.1 MFS transporter [Romeriopsis navalis LEGE 11480]
MSAPLKLEIPPNLRIRWLIPPVLAVTIFVNLLIRNSLPLMLPQIAQDFGWSDRQLGSNGELLLGVFFISYSLANMALSPIAERFGAKRSLVVAIIAFCGLTMLCTPFGTSLTALIILRLLLGLTQGIHIPILSVFISRWFPLQERSRANGLWSLGLMIAVSAAPLILVPIANGIGWQLAFTVIGVISLLLALPLLWKLVYDQPHQHPWIDPREIDYIQSVNQANRIESVPPTTNQRLNRTQLFIHDRRFWLATLGGSLNNFCTFGILNWLPVYLNRAKGIDFERLGWPLALVYAVGIIGLIVMAIVGDRLQKRSLLAALGFCVAGPMIYLATTSQTIGWVVFFFASAVFCQSAYLAQEYALIQRLLPATQIGTGTGIYNGLAVLFGGVGGSFIPGTIVASTGNFDLGMLSIVGGAGLAALIMFVLFRLTRY